MNIDKIDTIREKLNKARYNYINDYLKEKLDSSEKDILNRILELNEDDPLKKMLLNLDFQPKILRRLEIALQESTNIPELEDWLKDSFGRYFREKDISNRYGILGEIITASYFLELNNKSLKPMPTSNDQTPDFLYAYGENEIHIELNTQSMNNNENKRLKQFKANARQAKVSSITSVSPVGRNKKFKTTAENCINKFSNIKAESEQLKDGQTNILAINFFNPDFSSYSSTLINALHPIFMGNCDKGAIFSGFLWQAFYAKEGDKVFEDYRERSKNPNLIFSGMFERQEKQHISAALLFFMNKTVILENPNANKPLSKEVLLSLTCLNNFDLNLSQVRIPNTYYTKSKFSEKIEQQRNLINSINSEDLQV